MTRYWSCQQREAVERVFSRGLTPAQVRIVQALDEWFEELYEGCTLHDIMRITELSYGCVWTSLAVLEYFGYVTVQRDHRGRLYPRGIIPMFGFEVE